MEKEFENIGKKMPYTVPEGYFDAMHVKLSTIPARQKRVLAFRWISAAAAVVLVASFQTTGDPRFGHSGRL